MPVGGVVLDESIEPLMEQAWELLGSSDAMDALAAAYKPGRTFAQAFGGVLCEGVCGAGVAGAGCGGARGASAGCAGAAGGDRARR